MFFPLSDQTFSSIHHESQKLKFGCKFREKENVKVYS